MAPEYGTNRLHLGALGHLLESGVQIAIRIFLWCEHIIIIPGDEVSHFRVSASLQGESKFLSVFSCFIFSICWM